MSKPGVLAEPVLVGREKGLEELKSFLKSADIYVLYTTRIKLGGARNI